ncbi:MAG: D-alanyl-D-alanine carboxypeptidase family protein [Patescibacteria group bacterium]
MKFYSNSLLKIIRLNKRQWLAAGLLAGCFLWWPSYWVQNNYNRQGTLPRLSLSDQSEGINWSAVYDLSDLNLSSQNVLLVEADDLFVVAAKQPDQVKSLASLTKLMSLRLVRDSQLNLSSNIEVSPVSQITDWQAYINGDEAVSQLPVRQTETISVSQALLASAVASANNVVLALVKKVSPDSDNFVYKMNKTASRLGLRQTVFADPTGLNPLNRGTAREMAVVATWAWQDDFIRSAGALPETVIKTDRNSYRLFNTNQLTGNKAWLIDASKTGHLNEVGYNLVMRVKSSQDKVYLMVLLGAVSNEARQEDVGKIMTWLESIS